jgi:hypothetical protein
MSFSKFKRWRVANPLQAANPMPLTLRRQAVIGWQGPAECFG